MGKPLGKLSDRELIARAFCEIDKLKKRVKELEDGSPPVNPDPENNEFPYTFPITLS